MNLSTAITPTLKIDTNVADTIMPGKFMKIVNNENSTNFVI